jgi:hypothetical protein
MKINMIIEAFGLLVVCSIVGVSAFTLGHYYGRIAELRRFRKKISNKKSQ